MHARKIRMTGYSFEVRDKNQTLREHVCLQFFVYFFGAGYLGGAESFTGTR
jgi:hypothetical protein